MRDIETGNGIGRRMVSPCSSMRLVVYDFCSVKAGAIGREKQLVTTRMAMKSITTNGWGLNVPVAPNSFPAKKAKMDIAHRKMILNISVFLYKYSASEPSMRGGVSNAKPSCF